jgi:hypothetical protein
MGSCPHFFEVNMSISTLILNSFSIQKKFVTLFGNIPIGSTGAVGTLDPTKNLGIKSVVRNSAGKYTITLTQPYNYLMFMDYALVLASGAPSSGSNVNMSIRADNSNSSTPTIVVEFVGSAGTAVELTSGSVLLISPILKYGTV